MVTQIIPFSNNYTRLFLVAALSGVLVTGVMAQGRGNRSSDRDASVTHKVETKKEQSGKNSNTLPDSPRVISGSTSEARSTTSDINRPDRSNRGVSINKPSIDNRKPELTSSTRSDTWRNNTDKRNDNSAVDVRQSVDTRSRVDRGRATDKPAIENRKPELSRSDTWRSNSDDRNSGPTVSHKQSIDTRDRGNRNKANDNRKPDIDRSRNGNWQNNQRNRNDGAGIKHEVIVDRRNRDYRDRTPAYYNDRGRDNDRYRGYRPVFREGRYHYSARPNYRPALFGYWAFYDDPDFCRSVYYHYGYFPYMDRMRIQIGPYVRVAYYGSPIIYRSGDYYLNSRINSELDYALSGIRKSWLEGRVDLIDNHVRDDRMIAVLLDGEYDYSIEARDYLQMTSDAVDQTRTVSFVWERVRRHTNGDYTAFGKHTIRDYEGRTKVVYVSYTLRESGNRYYIEQVGSSNRPLD